MNRTLCDVLAEIRKCHETHNYSYLLGLVEEAQTMANRMEAGLGNKHDVEYREQKLASLKAEIKALKAEKAALEPDKPTVPDRFSF